MFRMTDRAREHIYYEESTLVLWKCTFTARRSFPVTRGAYSIKCDTDTMGYSVMYTLPDNVMGTLRVSSSMRMGTRAGQDQRAGSKASARLQRDCNRVTAIRTAIQLDCNIDCNSEDKSRLNF